MDTSLSSDLTLLLQGWWQRLQAWSREGRIAAAAVHALDLPEPPAALQAMEASLAAGDTSLLPAVVLLAGEALGSARAAYSAASGSVYLNADWLAGADAAAVEVVLTEELGHHLDALLRSSDSPGDEGERFAALLAGEGSAGSGAAAGGWGSDHGVLLLDQQALAVEYSQAISIPDLITAFGLHAQTFEASASGGSFLSAGLDFTGDVSLFQALTLLFRSSTDPLISISLVADNGSAFTGSLLQGSLILSRELSPFSPGGDYELDSITLWSQSGQNLSFGSSDPGWQNWLSQPGIGPTAFTLSSASPADTTAPELLEFALGATTYNRQLAGSAYLDASLSFSDPGAGFASAWAVFVHADSPQAEPIWLSFGAGVSGSYRAGSVVASTPLAPDTPLGLWSLDHLAIEDALGNAFAVSRSDQAWLSTLASLFGTADSEEIASLISFTVVSEGEAAGPEADLQPPQINALSFSQQQIAADGESLLGLTLTVADDSSGFRDGWLEFLSPSGQQSLTLGIDPSTLTGSSLAGSLFASLALDPGSEAGTWSLARLFVRDSADNVLALAADDPGWDAWLASGAIATDFTVSSDQQPDLTPPDLLAFSLSAATLDPAQPGGAFLGAAFSVQDQESGLESGWASFVPADPQVAQQVESVELSFWPGGSYPFGALRGSSQEGIAYASALLPPDLAEGTWQLDSLGIYDAAHNLRAWYAGDQASEDDPYWQAFFGQEPLPQFVVASQPLATSSVQASLLPSALAEDSGGIFLVRFTRMGDASAPLTIPYLVSGTAEFESDYAVETPAEQGWFHSASSGAVVFAAGQSSLTLRIEPLADLEPELDETLILIPQPEAGSGISLAPLTATIRDDEVLLSISSLDGPLLEGDGDQPGSFRFLISRSGSDLSAVEAFWQVGGAGFQEADALDFPADFPSGSVLLGAGVSSATITVAVAPDHEWETDEGFAVSLVAGSEGAVVDPAAAVAEAVIVNDDALFSIEPIDPIRIEGHEGLSPLVFLISRDGFRAREHTVGWQIAGLAPPPYEEAADGLDFAATQALSGSLSFAAGVETLSVSVLVRGDSDLEADLEWFEFSLRDPGPGSLIDPDAGATYAAIANDDAEISISADQDWLYEGQDGLRHFSFLIERSGSDSGSSSVRWAVQPTGGSPADATDFGGVLPQDTVVFLPGETSLRITVAVSADSTLEVDEGFAVVLSEPSPGSSLDPRADRAEALILNDDALLSLADDAPAQLEGQGEAGVPFVFTVNREGYSGSSLAVEWLITAPDPNPVEGDDFALGELPQGTLFLEPEQLSGQITIILQPDSLLEADESFRLQISAAQSGSQVDPTAAASSAIVLNDDAVVAITGLDPDQAEGQTAPTPYRFAISRSGYLGEDALIAWALSVDGETPADEDDFGGLFPTGQISFAAGIASLTLTIDVQPDSFVEADETFFIALDRPGPGHSIDPDAALASASIRNDDALFTVAPAAGQPEAENGLILLPEGQSGQTPFRFVVRRSGDLNAVHSVAWQVVSEAQDPSQDAADGLDFAGSLPSGQLSFGAGIAEQTLTVAVSADSLLEPEVEWFRLDLLNPGAGSLIDPDQASVFAAITNDDALLSISPEDPELYEGQQGGTVFRFLVERSGFLDQVSTATWRLNGSGAAAATPADFAGAALSGSVSFAPGESSRRISITVNADSTLEADEGFSVSLEATSAGTAVDPLAASAEAVIRNDDVRVSIVSLSPAAAAEGNSGTTPYQLVLQRSGHTAAAGSLSWAVSGSGSVPASAADFETGLFPGGALFFSEGDTTATVTIAVRGDTQIEADEGFAVSLSNPSPGSLIDPAAGAASAVILGDDIATLAFDPPLAVGLAEGSSSGGLFSAVVRRSGSTDGISTVAWAVGAPSGPPGSAADGSDFAGAFPSGSLSFASGETSRTVSFTIQADSTLEPDEQFTLSLSAPSPGTVISATSGMLTGTIRNDDAVLSATALSPASQPEGNSGSTAYRFLLSRSGSLDAALSASWAISGDGASPSLRAEAADFGGALPSGSVSFASGQASQTVTIEVQGDRQLESDEGFRLSLSAPSAGATLDPLAASAAAVIVNDDTVVALSLQPASLEEDGSGVLLYTFSRQGVISSALAVDLLVSGTAGFGTDYSVSGAGSFAAASGRISFSAGSSTATLTVDPSADDTLEGDESVALTLIEGETYRISSTSAVSGTILNDDAVLAITALGETSQLEGHAAGSTFLYRVSRSGNTSGTHGAQWALGGVGADPASASDFGGSFPSGTISFAAGVSALTLTVAVSADSALEADEGFSIALTAPAARTTIDPQAAAALGTIRNDDAEISLSLLAPTTVTEDGDERLVYQLTRNGFLDAALPVAIRLEGSASASDYALIAASSAAAGTASVSFAAGAASTSFSIDPEVDAAIEADETVLARLVSGLGYTILSSAAVTGVIGNDDPNVTLSLTPASGDESGGNLLAVFRRNQSSGSLSVQFRLSGSASFGSDYVATGATVGAGTAGGERTGTVSFAASAAAVTLTINPTDDTVPEADETVELALLASSAYVIGTTGTLTGTIRNDDTSLSLEVVNASVEEDSGSSQLFIFSRSGLLTNPLTVPFRVAGTATFLSDYEQNGGSFTATTPSTTTTGRINFPAGVATVSLSITPRSDDLVEVDEQVQITLLSGTGYSIATTAAVTGTIRNDDVSVSLAVSPSSVLEDAGARLLYVFSRSGVLSDSLPVAYSIAGTALFGSDYTLPGGGAGDAGGSGTITFEPLATTATLTVVPSPDSTVETDETVLLSLLPGSAYGISTSAALTGTIANDDTRITLAAGTGSVLENGSSNLTYILSRSGFSTAALSVNVAVAGGATLGSDVVVVSPSGFSGATGTVTFAAGATTATLQLDPTADNIPESGETVTLQLLPGTGYEVGTTAAIATTIVDDDATVTLDLVEQSVSEDGVANLLYVFSRTGYLDTALVVGFDEVNGTAQLTTDYTTSGHTTYSAASGSITFTAGRNSHTLTVTPKDDTNVEADETVELRLKAGNGYAIGTTDTVTGTIRNDDTSVSLTLQTPSINEDGDASLSYVFTRTGVLSTELLVNFAASGTAGNDDYTPSGAETFPGITPGNGTIRFAAGAPTATLLISPSDDETAEADETVAIALRAGTNYQPASTAAISGTIRNDDTVITLALAKTTAVENSTSNLVFVATRQGNLTSTLAVTYQVAGSASFGDDYTTPGNNSHGATSGVFNFAAGRASVTLTVDPVADGQVEEDETVRITLQPGNGYRLGTTAAVEGSILNDDPTISVILLDPASVAEDGSTNLIFQFSRNVVTASTQSARFSVGGTTNSSDYAITGATMSGTTGTVSFAAGKGTVLVTVNPTPDVDQEDDHNVSLTLVAGTGYALSTLAAAATGTILNDDLIGDSGNNTLEGRDPAGLPALPELLDGGGGIDTLTGRGAADVFRFRFGQSGLLNPDTITDFVFGTDKLQLLSATGAAFTPAAYRRLNNNSTASSLNALANAVYTDPVYKNLPVRNAVLIRAEHPAIAGTYLYVNDTTLARSDSADLLIKMDNPSGTLPAVGVVKWA